MHCMQFDYLTVAEAQLFITVTNDCFFKKIFIQKEHVSTELPVFQDY